MHLSGFILFENRRHYRVVLWDAEYLIPWEQEVPPTQTEIQFAIDSYFNGNYYQVTRIKL
jgi:hypothetical protein